MRFLCNPYLFDTLLNWTNRWVECEILVHDKAPDALLHLFFFQREESLELKVASEL